MALILFHLNIIKKYSFPQFVLKGWKFRQYRDILRLARIGEEINRDNDGRRISYTKGNSHLAQDAGRLSNPASTHRRNTRIQNWGFVACGSSGLSAISSREEEHTEEKITGLVSQQLNNNSAAQVVAYKFPRLPATTLSSLRRSVLILPDFSTKSQGKQACKGGGWRCIQ